MAISEKLIKINEEVVTQEDLLAQIMTALEGKAAGSSAEGSIEVIKRTIELDSNSQTITIPDIEKEPKMLFLARRVYISESTYQKDGNENYIDSDECFVTSLLYNSNEDFGIKFELANYVEDYDDGNDPTYYIYYDDRKQNNKYIQYNETTKEIIITPPDGYNPGCLFILGSYECYILYNQESESNGIDTSDANATSLDIRKGTSGYVNGVKIDGTVPTRNEDDVIVGDTSVTIPPGIYDEIIEKAISNSSASSFEWHQLDFISTYAPDPPEIYSFSIELKDDTFAIILRQTYSPATRCVLIYGSDYTFKTLQEAILIETTSPMPTLSVSNMTIEDGVLYGTYSGVDFVEYALIPLEATGSGSTTGTYETWVFTLEDGSIVEKEIEVGA